MGCAKLKNEIICAQGLLIALLNLDAIIDLIRNAAVRPQRVRVQCLMVFLS